MGNHVELLSMDAVARELGCSKGHVSKLINGKVKGTTVLKTVHVGRCRRVIRATFEKWLEENKRASEDNNKEDAQGDLGGNEAETAMAKGLIDKAPAQRRQTLVAVQEPATAFEPVV